MDRSYAPHPNPHGHPHSQPQSHLHPHHAAQPPPHPGPHRPSFGSYAPAVPQPLRQPTGDPFTGGRHDPFLSNSHDKRESHLPHPPYRPLDPPNGQGRYETLSSAPPPPASPYHHGPPLFREDRQRSITGSYLGGPLEPPQHSLPPPSARHMLPPASSPKDSPVPPHLQQNGRAPLPGPNSFGSSRDNSHGFSRPGSSMSLSHIMGADAGIGPRQPLWSPSGPPRPPITNNGGYTMPPSPQNDRRGAYEQRQRTPERRPDAHYGQSYPMPRPASPHAQPAYRPTEHNFARLLQTSQQHPPPAQAIPPRPFSQPAGYDAGGRMPGQRPIFDHPNMPQAQVHQDGASLEKAMRERAMSDLDGRRSIAALNRSVFEQPMSGYVPAEQQAYPRPPGLISEPPRPFDHRLFGTERPGLSPPTDQGAPNQQPPGYAAELGPGPGPAIVHGPPQFTEQNLVGRTDAFGPPPPREEQAPRNQDAMHGPRNIGNELVAQRPEEARRTVEDINNNHRSLLGINNEFSRRIDRASPLPQAVQGAQSQPPDIGRDPNIKSEFGRMFSGLGSGVGSTPVPAHTPLKRPLTPPSRPAVYEELGNQQSTGNKAQDVDSRKPLSNGTRTARAPKRPLEEANKIDGETPDNRITSATSTRGKRNKYTIPAGHHHHPLPATHHHHHHHKPDEAIPAGQGARPQSGSGFGNFKFPPNGQSTTPVPPHHHHHHPPHHHHHMPKPPPHHPVTTILTKQLVRDVSRYPRHHLGSQLYSPTPTLPAPTSSILGSDHVYDNIPNPLPRLEGKENCTLTIRVPRYFLTPQSRKAICAGRRLWGTDVYTDDSDPVAAAMHSGWLRGAWSADVDETMLSLDLQPAQNPAGTAAESDAATSAAAGDDKPPTRLDSPPPTGPVAPPPNVDLHLTLLILPSLEKYNSSVWHGVKSRMWGDNHDGVSFKIERMEWVDEGVASRNEERGGAARRRRLAALQGPGVGKRVNGILGAGVGGKVGGKRRVDVAGGAMGTKMAQMVRV